MRIRTLLAGAMMTVTLGAAAPAMAGSITLAGGTAGVIPGGSAANDYIGVLFPGASIGGYFGSQIETSGGRLLFEFFGAEAGYTNDFNVAGVQRFTHTGGTVIAASLGSALASYTATGVGSGLLAFNFDVNSNAGQVANGSNPNDFAGLALGPNFFASCNPFGTAAGSGGQRCRSVYLFLDDGGAGPDDDHDDFLVRITAVPEPATLSVFALGFAAVAGLRRRF